MHDPIQIEAREYWRLKEAEKRLRSLEAEREMERSRYHDRLRVLRKGKAVLVTRDGLECEIEFTLPSWGDGLPPLVIRRACASPLSQDTDTGPVSPSGMLFREYRYDGPHRLTGPFVPRYVEEMP